MFISIVYGIMGLLQSQFTQTQMRNLVFRLLNAHPRTILSLLRLLVTRERKRFLSTSTLKRKNKSSLPRKVQFMVAKYIAATMFTLALLVVALCPLLLVVTIIDNEIFLSWFPVSEHHDAVGAWGNVAAALLVLIVAVILQYQEPLVELILICFQGCLRLLGWEESDWVQDKIERGDRPKGSHAIRRRIKLLLKDVGKPFVYTFHSIGRTYASAKETLVDFKLWWKDPQEMSRSPWMTDRQKSKPTFSHEHYTPAAQNEHGAKGNSSDEDAGTHLTIGMQLLQILEQHIQSLKSQGYLPPISTDSDPSYDPIDLEPAIATATATPIPTINTLSPSPTPTECEPEGLRRYPQAVVTPSWSQEYYLVAADDDGEGVELVTRRVGGWGS